MADRLLFSKTGRAKYMSHRDLMRTFQRAFTRADIPIRATVGLHPHSFVSILLPLPVGHSSQCELLEFGLEAPQDREALPTRLNAALPEGIVVHRCYPAEQGRDKLAAVNYIINFEYPEGRPQETELAMQALLEQDRLMVSKRSPATGAPVRFDAAPLIRGWNLECQSDTMTLDVVLSAQNPGLNPELLRAAFCQTYPELIPDFVTFHRREVLDAEGRVFR